MTIVRTIATVAVILGGCGWGVAQADDVPVDEGPARAEEPSGKPAAKPMSEPKPAKPSLEEELLRRLTGEGEEEDDPFERAIRGMRDAQQKIAGKETGKPTRDVQEQVIRDIEKLIELAKQPPPPSQNQNPSQSQHSNPQQNPKSRGSSGAESRREERQTGESGAAPAEKSEADRARESTDEQRRAREREAELARRRDMIKDIWGHLPPSLRQKLLNVADEKSVPKYDELIRRYFESLAEEKR